MAQQKCTGLLVFKQTPGANNNAYPSFGSKCYGVSSSESDLVDLHTHDLTRDVAPELRNAQLYSFACLGSAVYQQAATVSNGETPPPFCLGVEFMQYAQSVMQHRAPPALPAAHHHTLPSSHDAAGTTGDMPVQLPSYHSTQHQEAVASTSSSSSSASPLPSHSHAEQQDRSSSSSSRNSRSSNAEDEPIEQLSFLERIERTRSELNERLEGKDPLWFAKAFANRASLNWASMKRMAGDMAAAAKADLGLQEPDEETE